MPKSNDTSKDVPQDAGTEDAQGPGLYGVAGAAAYLGVTESWVYKLAVRDRKLRYWQEQPPRDTDGVLTHGSPLVFKREWLDAYQATPRRKPGRPPKTKA